MVEQAEKEFAGYLHLAQNSATVEVGNYAIQGAALALASIVGGGGPHLHFAVSDNPESKRGPLVTIPVYFSSYMASDDYGKTWYEVTWGMPRVGQWIKRLQTVPEP